MLNDAPTAYDILGVSTNVTDADLRKAYRAQALKVHPDHRPDDPVAGQKFHELTEAYELLKDPTKRQALDASLRVKEARKQKYAAHDAKRKTLIDELEENERNYKRQRTEKAQQATVEAQELDRIREQSRRLREGKSKRSEPEVQPSSAPTTTYEIGPLDTTVRLKFQTSRFPSLITQMAIGNFLRSHGFTSFDPDAIVLSLKASKSRPDEPPKFCTALVPFSTVHDAFHAVCTSDSKSLVGIKVTWASGVEPPILANLEGIKDPESSKSEGYKNSASNTFLPLDLENITISRLHRAEREKLAQEIREQDEP